MRDSAQTCDTVLLVRPASFGFHREAAQSNAFAHPDEGNDSQSSALAEFEALRWALEEAGVRCLVLDDLADHVRPDAIFPNNWVSFHGDGTIVYYPMANVARRLERRPGAVIALLEQARIEASATVDLSDLEAQSDFLEGTGSLIFDRPAGRAFACLSPRTTPAAINAFERVTGYDVCVFEAADAKGRQIYHTNVMLMLGRRFAIVCADAIAPADRERVLCALAANGHEVIDVSFAQMEQFACNLIELKSTDGQPLIALSRTAFKCLDGAQRNSLERLGGALLAIDIPTIERVGGGSVRCMIAEVPLPASRQQPGV